MDRRIERDRDRELERQSGRYRERERDFSDRKDRDYSDEREHDKNLERTRSNRSRSPLPTTTASTRWDDPLKQFSEVHYKHPIINLTISLYFIFRNINRISPQNTAPHPIVLIFHLADNGTVLTDRMVLNWLISRNWLNKKGKGIWIINIL